MVKGSAFVVVIASLAAGVSATAVAQVRGRPAIRFAEMDRNNDREISRAEWTGSDRSFAVHDWNNDGVLSGDEVRVGAVRPPRPTDDRIFDSQDREYEFDDWTPQGFTALDHNRDGRITRDEWHLDRETFRRADHIGDGIVSRAEFLAEDQVDDDRNDRFADLDLNGDNRISRNEWHGTAARFVALDANRDGVITRVEMVGAGAPPELFSSVDVNRDRVITVDEWHWSRASFNARDLDHNGRLTREEFNGVALQPAASAAFKAGQARGLIEGRQAGREDKQRGVWDLEGQRELEQADSGYDASIGPRAEYQAGYREAFRRGYREGFGGV
jgi:Ca2+-binding EF-hand superfamily protein